LALGVAAVDSEQSFDLDESLVGGEVRDAAQLDSFVGGDESDDDGDHDMDLLDITSDSMPAGLDLVSPIKVFDVVRVYSSLDARATPAADTTTTTTTQHTWQCNATWQHTSH
jgi:hypothetical protein